MLLLHMLNIILSQKIIPNNEIEASHVVACLTSLCFHASKFQAPPKIYTKLTKKTTYAEQSNEKRTGIMILASPSTLLLV